ncbi:2-5A-dependent ribonuclease-like isoform X2 [Electrophorus electricus]|uniref:2-5A-dependent ribonuclease-like isoform X2 n=1 Tax=Electrophorus electricus TaxID=8005 RepID=UPI0015CFC334|nr:2-5A-dependent ribonuclease-like isoform X2 [Electrophorus electricus]
MLLQGEGSNRFWNSSQIYSSLNTRTTRSSTFSFQHADSAVSARLPEERVEYLKKLGNMEEVQNCRQAEEELLKALEEMTVGKTFSDWRAKFPSELVQKMEGRKPYPENILGLLRFIRNMHEHYSEDAEKINLMTSFPDLFGNVLKFAKKRGWNTKPSLRKMFNSPPVI